MCFTLDSTDRENSLLDITFGKGLLSSYKCRKYKDVESALSLSSVKMFFEGGNHTFFISLSLLVGSVAVTKQFLSICLLRTIIQMFSYNQNSTLF